MLKKNLKKEEALALATDLGLTQYIAIDNLIDGLQIGQNKAINVCVVTTDRAVAEYVLHDDLGIDAQLNSNYVLKLKACYGNFGCSIVTEYGELSIDKDLLKKTFVSSQKDVECAVEVPNERLKNLKLTLIYTPEYNCINNDTWRCMMLESDRTILVLSANHILYTGELEFIRSLVTPSHSPSRLTFGIGNAQYIRSSEWDDAIARVHLLTNEQYKVFPIFTEVISEERRSRYIGYNVTLDSILNDTQQELIALRETHFNDLDTYKSSVLEASLIKLKNELERYVANGIANTSSVELDKNIVAESKKHIEGKISLFLETPLIAKYRTAVEEFTELFKVSLKEDVQASENIKQDARSLPRYLTAIWEQFTEHQNMELYNEVKRNFSALIDWMNLDLRHITRNIRNIEIKNDVKQQLDSAFSVHTFFARKTNAGNSFTDALTIGGLLTSVFTPWGLAAILTSEVIKIAGKESIDNDYKKVLIEKIADVIERNKEELILQAGNNFAIITENIRGEIINYYDEIMKEIKDALNKEKERLAHATETIETINKII